MGPKFSHEKMGATFGVAMEGAKVQEGYAVCYLDTPTRSDFPSQVSQPTSQPSHENCSLAVRVVTCVFLVHPERWRKKQNGPKNQLEVLGGSSQDEVSG